MKIPPCLLAKLVVRNLKIVEGDYVFFYFKDDEVILRNALPNSDIYRALEDAKKEYRDAVSNTVLSIIEQINEFQFENPTHYR